MIKQTRPTTHLVRYGRIPEVARFDSVDQPSLERGCRVVVHTHRGLQMGVFLESVPAEPEVERPQILRVAGNNDRENFEELARRCDDEFSAWVRRIDDWNLDLQLVDLERTLDGEKLILYVINERGPDCTKLALHSAAGGFGIVEVQPVDETGIVELPNAAGGG